MRHIQYPAPDICPSGPGQGTWSDLRRAVLGLGLLAFAAAGAGCTTAAQQNDAGPADLTVLPQAARDALDRAAQTYPHPLDGVKWAKIHTLGGSDHPIYQLRGTNARGHTIELEVTGAGRVIEVEEHGVPLAEVPAPVVEAMKARMPLLSPARVEAIYQAGNPRPVSYGFEWTDSVDKTIEIYISADGKTFLN